MDTVINKAKIIEAIQQTHDERILFAINRLLQIENEIPQWHKGELESRARIRDNGDMEIYDWNDAKAEITKLD